MCVCVCVCVYAFGVRDFFDSTLAVHVECECRMNDGILLDYVEFLRRDPTHTMAQTADAVGFDLSLFSPPFDCRRNDTSHVQLYF